MSVFRKLLPSELDRYEEHLLHLSPDDRYARFAGFLSDEAIRKHCQALDLQKAILVGFFDRGTLYGVCELRMISNGAAPRAEAAFSVDRGFQNRGICTGLINRALTIARNRGVRVVDVVCLLQNRRMQAVARHYSDNVVVDSGEVVISIDIARSNQVSLLLELIDDGAGMLTTMLDQLQYSDGKAHVPFTGWAA